MRAIAVAHNFETAHRLPHLPGKCQSLHGHSWRVEVTIDAPGEPDLLVEFGEVKSRLREWIDGHLDHGVMLGARDPLADVLRTYGKLYVFDKALGWWPTVENVAAMLAGVTDKIVADLDTAPGARTARVEVQETAVNRAIWAATDD